MACACQGHLHAQATIIPLHDLTQIGGQGGGEFSETCPRGAFLTGLALHAADDVRRLADLRSLPFTTKHELVADQEAYPLFGTNLSFPLDQYVKYH